MIIYGIKHLVIEDNTSMGNYESPWTWEILSTSQNCSMVTMMNKPMGCWGTLFQTNTVRFHGPGRSSPLVETTIGGVLMVILFAVFFFYLGCWWCLVEFCLVNWRLPPREKRIGHRCNVCGQGVSLFRLSRSGRRSFHQKHGSPMTQRYRRFLKMGDPHRSIGIHRFQY